jgi:hypothetical protein
MAKHLLHTGFLLGWYSTLKMEVISSSETSLHLRIAGSYTTEDGKMYFI